MKKRIALLLSFVLVLSLALCACGGDKGGSETKTTIVGTWETDIDMTDMLNEQMVAAGVGDFITISSFNLTLIMEFNENGTGALRMDEKALEKSFEGLADDMAKGMKSYFSSMGLDLDELLAMEGMSMDDFIDEMMAEMDVESMGMEFNLEFNYKTEGDKLYISEDIDSEINTDTYNTYELKGNTLTLDAGNEVLDDGMEILFPMTLKRVK